MLVRIIMVLARDLVLAINLNFGFACAIPYYSVSPYYGVSPCHGVSSWPVFRLLRVLACIWWYVRVMVLTVNCDYGVSC